MLRNACAGEARLTPVFGETGQWQGRVHSVFRQVVNVTFLLEGEARLVVLCGPGLPLLPDSIVLPQGWLEETALFPGAPVLLSPGELWARGRSITLLRDLKWDGFMPPLAGRPAAGELREIEKRCKNGFGSFPPVLRPRIEAALTDGSAQRWLGLGAGLTPSFDDACVGVMALCRAVGHPTPFVLEDLSMTTEVSARYLRLGQEGYYGQPLGRLVATLFYGGVEKAARELLAVGASSGADMLHGVAAALSYLKA